ncbi:hypothetical protein BKI52_02525 [marine bacterium AO1-C]|nr:hypothetical protein BKI52_02525 [marine bacterium AO1-C]
MVFASGKREVFFHPELYTKTFDYLGSLKKRLIPRQINMKITLNAITKVASAYYKSNDKGHVLFGKFSTNGKMVEMEMKVRVGSRGNRKYIGNMKLISLDKGNTFNGMLTKKDGEQLKVSLRKQTQ